MAPMGSFARVMKDRIGQLNPLRSTGQPECCRANLVQQILLSAEWIPAVIMLLEDGGWLIRGDLP